MDAERTIAEIECLEFQCQRRFLCFLGLSSQTSVTIGGHATGIKCHALLSNVTVA
jgi:hypothetical protein